MGKLNKQAVWACMRRVAKCKKIKIVFLPACVWGLCVVFKSKIRPWGTKSEATAVIVNWGTLGDTKRIKQHRFHRGPLRGEGLFARTWEFSMLAGDARPEA